MPQTTSHILMIRPANFGFNEETAVNNEFQQGDHGIEHPSSKALLEFNAMAKQLSDLGVNVHIVQDSAEPKKPDAVFPNNWLSTHSDGAMITWPMYAKNRRIERQEYIINHLKDLFECGNHIQYEINEQDEIYLEGTGSLVLDRKFKRAYACLSDRTHQQLIEQFCKDMGYKAIVFQAVDDKQRSIYHTNVMMSVGSSLTIVCLDSIMDDGKERVVTQLKEDDKMIIEISIDQMHAFAGNMLEVQTNDGEALMLMSKSAKASLHVEQIEKIESQCRIIDFDISTIETIGGGSVRCMICEIFLSYKS